MRKLYKIMVICPFLPFFFLSAAFNFQLSTLNFKLSTKNYAGIAFMSNKICIFVQDLK